MDSDGVNTNSAVCIGKCRWGPPPLPTLVSLQLNPTNVIGGQTSQATLTLSGAAPAGGAVVMLSSSNGAASVPASVAVPEGAISASFTVNTTPVPAATSVSIGVRAIIQMSIDIVDRCFVTTSTPTSISKSTSTRRQPIPHRHNANANLDANIVTNANFDAGDVARTQFIHPQSNECQRRLGFHRHSDT
jgi:hypothetical protein